MSVSGCADWVFVTYSVKSEFPGQGPEQLLADTHHACDKPASYFYVLSVIQSQDALDGTHTVAERKHNQHKRRKFSAPQIKGTYQETKTIVKVDDKDTYTDGSTVKSQM